MKNKKQQHENGLNETCKEELDNTNGLNDHPDFNLQSNNYDFGPNFIKLPMNNQIKELQTVIRDK